MHRVQKVIVSCVFCMSCLVSGVAFGEERLNSGTDKKPFAAVPNQTQVTFVELGSVNCIPCKLMQPVMKDIEKTYGNKVKVVFYDVWTPAGQPYAEKYRIRAIPTQVFLDSKGIEFFRHTGFFSKAEIVDVLKKQGVK